MRLQVKLHFQNLFMHIGLSMRFTETELHNKLIFSQGDANNLHGFEIDQHVYLLMKKLAF